MRESSVLQGVYWIKPSDSNTGWNKENPHEQSLYLEQELRHGLGPSLQNTLTISIAHQSAQTNEGTILVRRLLF